MPFEEVEEMVDEWPSLDGYERLGNLIGYWLQARAHAPTKNNSGFDALGLKLLVQHHLHDMGAVPDIDTINPRVYLLQDIALDCQGDPLFHTICQH